MQLSEFSPGGQSAARHLTHYQLEDTPVPNTGPYDEIQNRNETLRATGPNRDEEYISTLDVPSSASPSSLAFHHHLQPLSVVQSETNMCELQQDAPPFSLLRPLSPISRCTPPPRAPRLGCTQLPLFDDDLDSEHDLSDAECAASVGQPCLDDWSSCLPSAEDTDTLDTELSDVDFEAFSLYDNALRLDLWAENSASYAFSTPSRRRPDIENGPRSRRTLPSPIDPLTSTLTPPSPFADINYTFDAPRPPLRRQSGSGVLRVSHGPDVSLSAEHTPPHALRTPPANPARYQCSSASDWDMSIDDDLGDESDASQFEDMSPPSLYEDSDLESDGSSIESPPETGELFSADYPAPKGETLETPDYSRLVDDLDDEMLLTPMEEDISFSLAPVSA